MEQTTARRMAARSWLLLLCLATATSITGVLQARAQPDSNGFISIDCGIPASYVDDVTKLLYVPDAAFIDAGSNNNISAKYMNPELRKPYLNVRSFPDGERNCYTLRTLDDATHKKFLLRAFFKYGNYDDLNRPPIFDLYIGVNFWTMVNITDADSTHVKEAIVVVPDVLVQVCLVNTGSGAPFISGLDLRPLKSTMYPQVNAAQGLALLFRNNFGLDIVRYPDDPYDRIWLPWPWIDTTNNWHTISTTEKITNPYKSFETPSKVMQTAITPRNASNNIEFFWEAEPQPKDPTPGYIGILHFSELELLPSNVSREFYINLNGKLFNSNILQFSTAYSPLYLCTQAVFNTDPDTGFPRYTVSLDATANSTLPPIINAIQVFSVISTAENGTDSQDVSAITAIKAKYKVQKNWMGDPCVPNTLAWDGLTCSYAISSPPRITGLNMSFIGLSGDISSSFANLKFLQYLDLSHNNLSGSIPNSLSQLSSLTVLDLTANHLSGSIPSRLLKRSQDGSLDLNYGNNPDLCIDADSCHISKGKSKLAMYIAIPVVLVVVVVSIVALLCFIMRRQKRPKNNTVKPQNEMPRSSVPQSDAPYTQTSLQLENRRFTYKELEMITNNFQRVLGRGGFGNVYDGFLEDGTQVAVKLRSDSSNQGFKEFLAEAQTLSRIHHKNLVSMIGYCKDEQYMALVYEYMPEGTLEEHISGHARNGGLLTWRQRLKIAVESAQGLEYLHKGCNPPLIHRDVKATNILLNAKLEAKIADFGLTKAFKRENDSHVSTNTVVGTIGYVDPEYQTTMQLTVKSDVYSFGVVLLVLITGRSAIVRDPEPTSIVYYARQRLARGNIEGVVDSRMRGEHDVNSVWKAADIAFHCTAQASAQRPTMTNVVAQLQECLELEDANGVANGGFYTSRTNDLYTADSQLSEVCQSRIAFEVEHNFGRVPTMPTGPATR